MNKNDLRYIKTNHLIKETFIDLIIEYGYAKTTITLICQRALISRNTFYLHYQTIDDLLHDLCLDLEKDFKKINPDTNYIKDCTRWYIDVIDQNRKLVLALLACPTTNLHDLLYRYVVREPMLNQYDHFDCLVAKPHIQLNIAYMLEAMISFTRCWLNHYPQMPIEEVVDELAILCRNPSNEFLKKLKKVNQKGS